MDCGQGFCLLNNVAIGAMHARLAWGVRRFAVVDIDVHFGNGTAEILDGDDDAIDDIDENLRGIRRRICFVLFRSFGRGLLPFQAAQQFGEKGGFLIVQSQIRVRPLQLIVDRQRVRR